MSMPEPGRQGSEAGEGRAANFHEVGSRIDRCYMPAAEWAECVYAPRTCRKCWCLLPAADMSIDVELEVLGRAGPVLTMYHRFAFFGLRTDLLEVLRLDPRYFFLGTISVNGRLLDQYRSVVATVDVAVHYHAATSRNSGCEVCGRVRRWDADVIGERWLLGSELPALGVLTQVSGAALLISQSVVDRLGRSLRSELVLNPIPVRPGAR